MSLADSLSAAQPMRKGPQCTVCSIIDSLSDADAATLEAAMKDTRFDAEQIARALTMEGHRVAGATVGRHRRGSCLGAG
jgi:hypothetical protein